MSFYVKRSSSKNPAGFAFVGPIRCESQARKEAAAWLDAGETAEVFESTLAVRADVRRWDTISHASDAGEIITFRDEKMTMAAYHLLELDGGKSDPRPDPLTHPEYWTE